MLEHLYDGGYMMAPLVVCSIIALAVILDRFLAFRRYAAVDNRSLRAQVMRHIWQDEIDKAALLCSQTPGPISAVLLAGVQAYQSAQDRESSIPITVTVKEAMDDYAIHALSAVEKRFSVLSTIGNAAPLMGMTGTVTGMIASFAAMSEGGVNNSAVAGGISEALITTAGGLIVALIAVIPYNYFNSLSDSVDLEIEEVKAQFVDTVAEGSLSMSRARNLRRQRKRNDSVPVDAFSDIAFLIIIFFLVATTLSKTSGFETELPSSKDGESKSETQVPMIELINQQILYNDQPIEFAQLRETLTSLKLGEQDDSSKRLIKLKSAPTVTYEQYYPIWALIAQSGGVVALVKEKK